MMENNLIKLNLKDKIYEIRGQKVMLDFELAEIYGYDTRSFNKQVTNNLKKFEGEEFRFQLTQEEYQNLMCKNYTSSWGGRRKMPHTFTEQGVYMLMTVLCGGSSKDAGSKKTVIPELKITDELKKALRV